MNHDHNHAEMETTTKDYILFVCILLGIFIVSLALEHFRGTFTAADFMRLFMGVFFLVFAIFKLLDMPGFAMSYIGYDIIAKKITAYAYAYPFLELALALGYFLNVSGTNYATIILMLIGSIGVTKELLRGSKIKCACLGTYVKLPLTTISLIEDLAMGIMALLLILHVF